MPGSIYPSIAPGTRVRIRDEEWLVRNLDQTTSGGEVYGVVGLSALVERKEARFLREIEEAYDGIKVIDPRQTRAVADPSPFYRESQLMLESHFRATTPGSTAIHLGHQGAMDVLPFQLEPTTLALSQPRQRILIADAVGLGKTIECGNLLAELIKRGQGRRILVVTVKSMLTQSRRRSGPASPFPSRGLTAPDCRSCNGRRWTKNEKNGRSASSTSPPPEQRTACWWRRRSSKSESNERS